MTSLSDEALINLALTITADRIVTDPWLRDSLTERLPSADPDQIVARLVALSAKHSAAATNLNEARPLAELTRQPRNVRRSQ